MNLTRNEKKVFRALYIIVLGESGIIALTYLLYQFVLIKIEERNFGLFVAFISVSFLVQNIVLLVCNRWVLRIVYKALTWFSGDPIYGQWTLKIEYTDKEGVYKQRIGNCNIEESYLGLKISGGSIRDFTTNDKEVHSWIADKVDILLFDTSEILVYIYITYDTENTNYPTKIGLVNAKKKTSDEYEGVFRDFEGEGKTIREGKVTLTKMD